jgi:hypothetical protein
MVVIGTCVAGIVADIDSDSPPPPPPIRHEIAKQAAPPPTPPQIPDRYELPPDPPPEWQPPRELSGLFRYTGEITGPEAFAGLKLGQRCEIWIEPNPGGLNCRWYIDCGKPRRRIYGGGTVGYSTCEIDDQGHPMRAQDEEDDAPDGAFLADFTVDPKMIILEDRWLEPPVRVIISIEEGGPHDGPIPQTKLAPRDSQEEIQARINLGESPLIEAGVIADW